MVDYFRYSSVMRNAAVAAKGASVQVNTHSAAKKYNAPVGLTPESALSVAPARKINSGIASGSTIKERSTLPRRNPTVRPAPMAPSQLKCRVHSPKLSIIVQNPLPGIPSAVPTMGDTKTSATPVTNQCAKVFATTMSVSPCPESASCSKVPSSASLLNSASSDNRDDSSAATQSTPGAMSRSSDNSKLNPKGNNVVTIKKNTKGCNNWSGRRKLRHSSRRTTKLNASKTPTFMIRDPGGAYRRRF